MDWQTQIEQAAAQEVQRTAFPDDYHCYEVVRVGFRRIGIDLPVHPADHQDARACGASIRHALRDPIWHSTPTAGPGCVALLARGARPPHHVALCLGSARVAHWSSETDGVVIVRLLDLLRHWRLCGIYRHGGLPR